MKSMKKLVLAGLVLLASVMVLAGCKNDSVPEVPHEHSFAEQWTYDGTHHWKAATCGHSEVSEEAEHTFVEEVCTECSLFVPAGFVYIPKGSFQMGSNAGDNSKPVHDVTISKGFFMGKYEVTQSEYLDVMGAWGDSEPSEIDGKGDDYPAYNVSWYDAVVYCNELTKKDMEENSCVYYSDKDFKTVYTRKDGENQKLPYMNFNKNGYRLPTEAEWEYAARGGNSTTEELIWSGTDKEKELGNYAWYWNNSDEKTHEVGMKYPNKYGLCDMSGNVLEWCWDWYAGDYYKQTEGVSDPKGASSGDYRVLRGGSWNDYASLASVSNRGNDYPYYRYFLFGFRVVRASSK